MEYLFVGIFASWGVGMAIFILSSKSKKYNHIQYFDLSDRIRKYKMYDEKVNINKKK
jgi:hypothetical protein